MPALFTIGKEKNVVQGGIKRIQMADSFQSIAISRSPQTNNDFSVLINLLLTISRNYGSNFICSWQIVAAMICCRLQDDARLNSGLLIGREFTHDLIGMFVKWNIGMCIIEHGLKIRHNHGIAIWISGGMDIEGSIGIVDIELCICRTCGASIIIIG